MFLTPGAGRRDLDGRVRAAKRRSSTRSGMLRGSWTPPMSVAGASPTCSRRTSTTTTCRVRWASGPRRAPRSSCPPVAATGSHTAPWMRVPRWPSGTSRWSPWRPPVTPRSTSPGRSWRTATVTPDGRAHRRQPAGRQRRAHRPAGRRLGPVASTDDQLRSLQRLSRLPASVRVLPTHGAGSFCSAGPASTDRSSTHGPGAGHQRAAADDPARAVPSPAAGQPRSLSRLLRPHGRHQPRGRDRLPGGGAPPSLPPALVADLQDRGAWIVDARDRWAFAAGHVPGSIHVEATDSFASWVGAVVPFGAAIVLVMPERPAGPRRGPGRRPVAHRL